MKVLVSEHYSLKDKKVKIINNYTSVYDATIVSRLKEKNYEVGNNFTNYDYYLTIDENTKYKDKIKYKPTYGLLSRYGVITFTTTLLSPVILLDDIAKLIPFINDIKGIDSFDMTTINIEDLKKEDKEYKIGNYNKDVTSTYELIKLCEICTNTSNLTGILTSTNGEGSAVDEQVINYRTNNLSSEIKKSIIKGAYLLSEENIDKYYLKALRLRRVIISEINELFKTNDALIIPNENIAYLGGYPFIYLHDGSILMGNIKEDNKLINILINSEVK